MPKVGAECTICHPNDRYAAVVVEASKNCCYVLKKGCFAKSTFCGVAQDNRDKFTRRADGRWVKAGQSSPSLRFDICEDYRAPEI